MEGTPPTRGSAGVVERSRAGMSRYRNAGVLCWVDIQGDLVNGLVRQCMTGDPFAIHVA
jgi:hypothetical protein